MKKVVFKPQEIVPLSTSFVIGPPEPEEKEEDLEDVTPLESYSGPTADDLRREAEAFKAQWEKEKEAMIAAARAEAEEIIKRAEATAFQEVKRKNDQALAIRHEAELAAEKALADAEQKIKEMERQAQARINEITNEAYKKGFEQGREEGFKAEKAELERLIQRLHTIIERTLDKREEILNNTESQIVELVLLISRKVVKTISENQKSVIISNIAQALRKLKTRSDIIIRVNIADLQLASEHLKEFTDMVENAKNISIVEDTTVDKGGCIIETDFGEIDARIQSQLNELEEKILDIAPIKSKGKSQ
ncbi:MAG TPA: flagellar assembly protein FliH [Spirochaetales bacterium]|nr:flagellar assembly protein FliH [Spirochaetales bacterium]HQK33324.1 flagellar assembly protein FliH [Spirochaetales bacterium]